MIRPITIGDIGANHNQDWERYLDLVNEWSGVIDGVKIQLFDPEKLYRNPTEEQLDSLRKAAWPKEWSLIDAKKEANKNNLLFGITPFSEEFLEMCTKDTCDFIKISSFDSNRLDFLSKARDKSIEIQAPLIVSVGQSNKDQIGLIADTLGRNMKPAPNILHCVSKYPAKSDEVNLDMLGYLQYYFANVTSTIGYSDHTASPKVLVAASSLRASLLEIHIDCCDKMGREFHHGHCWTKSKFSTYTDYLEFLNFKEIEGSWDAHFAKIDSSQGADPKDGMRPMLGAE